jgi:hypothetical protein
MNYLEWNNALINHFFNSENEEKEVTLYFSEDVINEIGEKNYNLPEGGYVSDFLSALQNGVAGIQNNDYINRILELETHYSKGCRRVAQIPFNYPPYLTYLLSFILPFTSGTIPEGLRMNNFHDIVKQYFEGKKLTKNYDGQIRLRLSEIDHLWDNLFNWLFESNNISLGYIEKIDNPAPNRRYVSKFEYHIIFRKEQEDKLSLIFDNNNILPNEPIDESKIRQLIVDNAAELRLSKDVVDKIKSREYIGEKLVKRAFNYYKNWDGTNRFDYSKNSDSSIIKRGFSRKRIVLCLDFNKVTQAIMIKYIRTYSLDGLPEDFTLTDKAGKEYRNIEQCTQYPLYSNAIASCFQTINENIELQDKSNRIKYTWKSKEFYLFKKDTRLNDWVEIPKIEFNVGITLIISKRNFFDAQLKDWFENENIPTNHKKLYNDNLKNNLPDNWIALTIEKITNYQHSDLPELKTTPEIIPTINFDKEFYFDACFYIDILPNIWIENYEVDDKLIFAEYCDGSKINLEKIGDSALYKFTDEHIKRINQEFKIKHPSIKSYPRFVKIIAFDKKKTNLEIEQTQPKRNIIGNSIKPYDNPTNYFQGIEHHFSEETIRKLKQTQRNPVTGESFFISTQNVEVIKSSNDYNKSNKGNILINYISAKGKISKNEYDNAVITLLHNVENNFNLKKQIRYSLYSLQNLGYIDYDAEQGNIYINKASLIVKPTESGTTLLLVGSRDNKFIQDIISFSKKGGCYIDIQNSLSELLPQTILVKFKKGDHNVVNDFSKHFNLQFKNEGQLFTQFALANANNLDSWENYVEKTADLNLVSDLEGGQLFDVETLRFKSKPDDFNKEIGFTWFSGVNGYKDLYRLWYKSEAYHIAERHFGLYLYLSLYRKLKIDEYDSERELGTINHFEHIQKVKEIESLTNVLLYVESKKWLLVPLSCALPKYYAIAFTLLSGENPEILYYNNKAYLIYKNVPFLFCNNSLILSLKQKIKKINL